MAGFATGLVVVRMPVCFRRVMAVLVLMRVLMAVVEVMVMPRALLTSMPLLLLLLLLAPVLVFVLVFVPMLVPVFVQVDIELGPGDATAGAPGDVEVVPGNAEPTELTFEFRRGDAEIEQGAEEHVTADAAEDVEVEGFHSAGLARALICEAA
jgi:hypothetical protein